MAHIGLKPQIAASVSGLKVQGRGVAEARRLLDEAIALEQAGAFAIVLECIPSLLARVIDETLTIPTIGCGAGPYAYTLAQNLNADTLLGIFDKFAPNLRNNMETLGGVGRERSVCLGGSVMRRACARCR